MLVFPEMLPLLPDASELYSAPAWAPHQDLRWLETCLNVQSIQFMVDCLPAIQTLFQRCWIGLPLRVLDVGTGSGAGANLLATLYSGRLLGFEATVDAMEIASSLERYARARFPLINYLVGDAWDLKPQDPWDMVICSHTIEHVERPVEFLRHLQALARHWVFVYAPYNEIDRIPGHINTIDDTFLETIGAGDRRIAFSPAWNPQVHKDPMCVSFTLPGRGHSGT